MSKNRIFYLDQLRVLAIMGIVFCHGSSIYYCNPRILTNFNISFFITFFTSGRFISIPLFVMISGVLTLILSKIPFINRFSGVT